MALDKLILRYFMKDKVLTSIMLRRGNHGVKESISPQIRSIAVINVSSTKFLKKKICTKYSGQMLSLVMMLIWRKNVTMIWWRLLCFQSPLINAMIQSKVIRTKVIFISFIIMCKRTLICLSHSQSEKFQLLKTSRPNL